MIQIKRYFKYDPDKHAENKYNHLLIGMMVVFLVGPLLRMTSLAFPLAACLFFGIIQFALKATVDSKKLLKCYQILVLMALACVLLSQLKSISPATSKVLYVFGRAMHIVFLALTIRLFIKRIIVAERVTAACVSPDTQYMDLMLKDME